MKNIIILIVVIILVVWGFVALSSKPEDVVQGDTVKIGVILPLSGDVGVYGEPAQKVYQIAVDEINASGGIKGKPIELVIEDGACSGEGAVSAAQKLVNIDHVQVIIGGFCSAESLAAIPVAETGKVALISPASSNPGLTGKSPYFFRNYPSDNTQGSILAQLAYDQGKRKVAFIQEQTDYNAGIYEAFSVKFKGLGGEVIKEEYPSTSKDFRSQLTKLQSQNPDILFINANTPAAMEAITQQMTALNWKVALFTNDVFLGATDLLVKYKDALEGMIGAEFGVDPSNEKFKHLADVYKTKYGTDLPYQSYAQTEYDAVYIVKDAIESVGYNGTKIAAFGHQISNWQGAAGTVTIGSNGDIASGHKPEIVKGGKVQPL